MICQPITCQTSCTGDGPRRPGEATMLTLHNAIAQTITMYYTSNYYVATII